MLRGPSKDPAAAGREARVGGYPIFCSSTHDEVLSCDFPLHAPARRVVWPRLRRHHKLAPTRSASGIRWCGSYRRRRFRHGPASPPSPGISRLPRHPLERGLAESSRRIRVGSDCASGESVRTVVIHVVLNSYVASRYRPGGRVGRDGRCAAWRRCGIGGHRWCAPTRRAYRPSPGWSGLLPQAWRFHVRGQ